MVLDIPCLDGAVPASTADNSVIRREATTELLPAPEDRQIRIVTASDWAPYLNEDQEQGGMITEIVNVSMQKVTEEGGLQDRLHQRLGCASAAADIGQRL